MKMRKLLPLRSIFVCATASWFAACSARPGIVKQINEEYCRPLDDGYGDTRKRHLDELQKSGEKGRQALLQVARTEGPNRGCALMYLCAFDDPRGLAAAREVLQQGDAAPDVLMNALGCVGASRNPLFIEEIRPYLRNSVQSVSQFAVNALASIEDEQARALLRNLLEEPEHEYFEQVVIRALAQLRDREAVALIVETAAQPNANDLVRFESVSALASIDASGTLEESLSLVRNIETGATRVSALEAVWRGLQSQLASLPVDANQERTSIELSIEDVKRLIKQN